LLFYKAILILETFNVTVLVLESKIPFSLSFSGKLSHEESQKIVAQLEARALVKACIPSVTS